MNRAAKAYLCATLGVGLLLAAFAAIAWQPTTLPVYAAFLLLTFVASLFRVKLPGMDGTYSLSFIFLLVAVDVFPLAETMLLASVAAAVQSLWRRKKRPTAAQIRFNVACLIVTVTACYGVNQLAFQAFGSRLITLLFVAVVYFVVNTCMVSAMMALVAGERISTVWRQWFLWSFPYYVVGAGIATAASMSDGRLSTRILGASLPFLYLMYAYYRELLGHTQSRLNRTASAS